MDDRPAITTGLTGTASLTVGNADTATAMGSGDVPVLATPRVVALVEEAACVAVAGRLAAGQTSVGVRIELDHRKATRVGAAVTATATVAGVDGRKLDFEATVTEDGTEVARARHRRVTASRKGFED